MSDAEVKRADLIKPNRSFDEWFAKLCELNGLVDAYDELAPEDWREYYDSWYTPGEALNEDQSYE